MSGLALVPALLTGMALASSAFGQTPATTSQAPVQAAPDKALLSEAALAAERQLHQTFTNLQIDEFGPAPVTGPIYQASAGGKVIYYAPESEHILFATVYDRNGINVTALAQSERAQKQLSAIDPSKALTLGPVDAPSVIEFTDPDCSYCRALDHYWATKAAEGKPVRRLIFFVSGIHPQAAAKAEHILCSPDPAASFKAAYEGTPAAQLATCAKGHAKVEADSALVRTIGVSGTPTLILDGKLVSGFQQGEIESFLASHAKGAGKISPTTVAAPKAQAVPGTGHDH